MLPAPRGAGENKNLPAQSHVLPAPGRRAMLNVESCTVMQSVLHWQYAMARHATHLSLKKNKKNKKTSVYNRRLSIQGHELFTSYRILKWQLSLFNTWGNFPQNTSISKLAGPIKSIIFFDPIFIMPFATWGPLGNWAKIKADHYISETSQKRVLFIKRKWAKI